MKVLHVFCLFICLIATSCLKQAPLKPEFALEKTKETINETSSLAASTSEQAIKQTLPQEEKTKRIATEANKHDNDILGRKAQKNTQQKSNKLYTFNIPIHNAMQSTMYICAFGYAKRGPLDLWRWHKSNICKLEEGQTDSVSLSVFYENKQNINHIFGVLGVFNSLEEAENATYELTPDKNKIDIDLLARIEGEIITIKIEKYGIAQSFYEYSTPSNQGNQTEHSFNLINKTTRTVHACCFVYEDRKKVFNSLDKASDIDHTNWRYYKSSTYTLPLGQAQKIVLPQITKDIATNQETEKPILCYLAIFGENEQAEAENCTFQTLEDKHKLALGTLDEIENSAIILDIDRYAAHANNFSFRQETRRLNLNNLHIRRNKKHL